MLRTVLTALLITVLIFGVGAGKSYAEMQEVTVTGEYTYGDRETREENERLKQMFMTYKIGEYGIDTCRIGGYRDESGIWRWINGKIIANYFDWGDGQPRHSTLIFNKELDGRWETIDSDGWDSERIFMCEWESASDAHDSTL